MQSHDDRQVPARTEGNSPATGASPSTASTKRDLLEPYIPPNVPHGLPHVVRFATLSSMDLPAEARFLIVTLARFADHSGLASVALDTLCAICRIGSHHTVTRYITMAEEIGILRKMPGQGGKDRQSHKYLFLGEVRQWRFLPVNHPDDNPDIVLAEARMRPPSRQACRPTASGFPAPQAPRSHQDRRDYLTVMENHRNRRYCSTAGNRTFPSRSSGEAGAALSSREPGTAASGRQSMPRSSALNKTNPLIEQPQLETSPNDPLPDHYAPLQDRSAQGCARGVSDD